MPEHINELRVKAQRCRRLAEFATDQMTIDALVTLAQEYESELACLARPASERRILLSS